MNKTRIILTATLAFATFFGVWSRGARTCEAKIGLRASSGSALLIAVDEYDDDKLPTARYGNEDAQRLGKLIPDNLAGYWLKLTTLTTGDDSRREPTKENILAALEELEGDFVFIAFIGWCVNYDGETYWAPRDAEVSRDDSGKIEIVKETFISEAEIRARLKDLKAGQVFYLSDVVVESVGIEDDGLGIGARPNLLDLPGVDSAWELQTCSPGELGWELNEIGGSPAIAAFLEAFIVDPWNGDRKRCGDLDGDGSVTCLEAALYVRRRTGEILDEHWSAGLPPGARQTPRLIGSGKDFPLHFEPYEP